MAAGLGALLDHLAEHPDEARFAIVEVLAAGPKALARRDAALRQFTGFLDAGRAETSVELPGITSLSLAGGINELLYSEILHGAAAALAEPPAGPDVLGRPSRSWAPMGPPGSASGPDSRCRSARKASSTALFHVDWRVSSVPDAGILAGGGISEAFRLAAARDGQAEKGET